MRLNNMRALVRLGVVLLIVTLLTGGCQAPVSEVAQGPSAAPEVVAAETPSTVSVTPLLTVSVTPSLTDLPTFTPTPIDTRTPTNTPLPTATKRPKTIRETDNILLLGTDQRPDEGTWRTDTIMIAALDYEANRVGVVSIPRDLWVEIPGYGMGRINQADFQGEYQKYPGGGPKMAADIIEANFGIPSQRWVRLRLEALPELVEALGGVTVTLDCPLHEVTPDPANPAAYLHFDLPAGDVFLNGEDAAKFARYRYTTSDFSRTQRQQQLIWAIREQALRVDAIPKIPELWRALANTFKTDLSLLDVIRLARLGAKLDSSQVRGLVFSNKAIQPVVLDSGAQVVKITDRAQFDRELVGLFEGQPLALQGRGGSNGYCPPPAPPPPLMPPTSDATPEAPSDEMPEVTPTPTTGE